MITQLATFSLAPWYDGAPFDDNAILHAANDFQIYELHLVKLAIGNTHSHVPTPAFNLEDFIAKLSCTDLFREIVPGHYLYYKGVRFSTFRIPQGHGLGSLVFMIRTRQEYRTDRNYGDVRSYMEGQILVPSKLHADPAFADCFKAIGYKPVLIDYAAITEQYNNSHGVFQTQVIQEA